METCKDRAVREMEESSALDAAIVHGLSSLSLEVVAAVNFYLRDDRSCHFSHWSESDLS